MEVRGIYFTYDALLALVIIFGIFLIINTIEKPSKDLPTDFSLLSSVAEDSLQIMSISKLRESFPDSYLQYLLSNSVLEEQDLNKSVIEALGILWASENFSIAKNLSAEFLRNLIPKESSFSLNIEDNGTTAIYSHGNLSKANMVAKAERIISGIKRNLPKYGYVARARALKIERNTTKVFNIPTEGAGNKGGKFELTKKFFLNASKINNATLYISVHYGSSADQFESIKLNDRNIKNNINWLYQESSSSGTGAFGYVNVINEINSGNNTLYLRIKNNEYNAHIHPGMFLVVEYESEDFFALDNVTVKERIYFDHLMSRELSSGGSRACYSSHESGRRRTGVWATIPFFIPYNAVNFKATLNLNIKDVEDYWDFDRWHYEWINGWRIRGNNGNATDVRVYLNSNESNPIYKDGDYMCATSYGPNYEGYIYCPSLNEDFLGTKNVSLTLNLTPYLIKGTNVLSVYANTYRDWFCGRDYTELYSDPFENPENSSYIDVEYKLTREGLKFGAIDLGIVENFGGVPSNPKQADFSFPEFELLKTFLHVAQVFSFMINVDVQPENEDSKRVFSSPSSRAVPSKIFLDPIFFNITKKNTIYMEDTGSSGNDFLPETALEYVVLLPDHVPYGDIFDSEQEAKDNAVSRLESLLGNFMNVTQIDVDSVSVGNVPWMWGPAKITLEVGK